MQTVQETPRFVTVTKEQFFAYVGPRDIVVSAQRDCSIWETRDRCTVGRSTPGYASPYGTPKTWQLTPAAIAELQR